MNTIVHFIEANSFALLALLGRRSKGDLTLAASLAFVEDVLDDFSNQYGGVKLPEPSPMERTFWSTLYELEEATEASICIAANPRHSADVRPFLKMIDQNLIELEHALKHNHAQEKFFATRPGEWSFPLDEEDSFLMDN